MDDMHLPYEVETRFHFVSYEEACVRIPFLNDTLNLDDKQVWTSHVYGRDIYESGRLLRIGTLFPDTDPRHFLCLKGEDTGSFANIRQELDEDVTNGTHGNIVFSRLGEKTDFDTIEDMIDELHRLGHYEFMAFSGEDAYGTYEPYGIEIKLMRCADLPYPLMVEFEKIASSLEQALAFEADLKRLTEELKLADRHLKDEPPTLRYKKLFGKWEKTH